MMRSLWSGVAGLNTHQMEMDVIGNNISNVNTTAYKSQATGFTDILYQTIKTGTGGGNNRASTNAAQVGLGSKIGSIYTNISAQGSAITTDNVLDLMITGDSFFVVNVDGVNQFTRDGSFTIDADGFLVTQNNGYYVRGVNGGEVGNAAPDNLQVINRRAIDWDGDGNEEMLDYVLGEATSEAYLKGNIDKDDSTLEDGKNLLLEVYGKDGNQYTIKFNVTDAGDSEDNTYELSIEKIMDSDGNEVSNSNQAESLILTYGKSDGRLESIATKTTNADGEAQIGEAQSVTSYEFSFGGDASVLDNINVDLSNTTNYASTNGTQTSTIYAYRGDTEGLNQGYAKGTLTGFSIGTDGTIYGKYSNGQSILKGQIAVAQFTNAMGLEKTGDNMYAASLNSGNPMYGDITEQGGYMNSGVLEGSNVNLAKEFTDMITTQRGFQANSRVITTSDEMLQLLKSLKR